MIPPRDREENRSGKDRIFYKQRPYIYMAIAVIGFFLSQRSKLAFVCGLVLVICGFIILELRNRYQEKQHQLELQRRAMELKRKKEETGSFDIKIK